MKTSTFTSSGDVYEPLDNMHYHLINAAASDFLHTRPSEGLTDFPVQRERKNPGKLGKNKSLNKL